MTHDQATRASRPNAQALLRALEAAFPGRCQLVDQEPTSGDEGVDPDDWKERLRVRAAAAGYATSTSRHVLARALTLAAPDAPLLTCLQAKLGSPLWLVLRGRKGRLADGVLVDGERHRRLRVSTKELAAQLAVDLDAAREWVRVEPAFPWEGLRATPDAPRAPLSRLWSLVRLEATSIWGVLIYGLFIGLLTLATPLAVQALVNTIAFGALLQPLVVLTLLLFIGLAAAGTLRVLETIVVEMLQRRLFVGAVGDLANRLTRLRANLHDHYYAPELVNRFFDVVTLQKAASSLLLDGIGLALQSLVGMLILAFYHPLLLALSALLMLALAGVLFGLGRGAIATSKEESQAKYEVVSWLQDVARQPTTFSASATAAAAVGRADGLTRDYLRARGAHFRRVLRQTSGLVALHALASAALLGIGGFLVMKGQLTLGQLVAAELIVTAVVGSIAKFGKHLDTAYDALAAVDKIGKLVDLPLEATGGGKLQAATGLSLSLEGVRLTLGGKAALQAVSLSLKAGQRLGIAGPGGSGKSLLLELLHGRREPSAGRIRIGEQPLDRLELQGLRDQVVLLRDATLFAGSVANNIAAGRPIPSEAIRAVLTELGICECIESLPEGLQTEITAGGAPLPSSLRTLLVMARALAGRPSLLLVDGLLDGLDAASKEAALAALLPAGRSFTTVIVSNDETVLSRCDRTLRLTSSAQHVEVTP